MIKKFIGYYKPYKKLFFADIFAALVLAGCNLIYPILTRKFIGVYVPAQDINMMMLTIGILLVTFIMKYGLNYFIQYWGHIMGVKIQCDIRQDAFNHLQKLPFGYFDQARSGTIMSRIINDTQDIGEFAHHGPEDLIISVFTMIGAFIYMLTMNVMLTLIIFALIPVLIAFSIKRRKALSEASMKSRVEVGKINANLENSIAGVRVSKAYDAEAVEQDKFQKGNKRFLKSKAEHYKVMANFYSGTYLILDLLVLVTFALSGYFAILGKISIADFTAYLFFINTFINPIRNLIVFTEQLQSGMTGFQRVQELLAEPLEPNDPLAKELTHVDGDIEFRGVTFRYDSGHENVFSNLNLKVDKGTTLALVGPSGGGKSTLCHLLPRFYEIDSGEILLDSVNINDYTLFSLRQQIGIVQQDTFLFTGTIRDNIAYGNFGASEEQVEAAAKAANIHEFVMSLPEGYDTFIGERGVMLSGGQKQRISIARVFLKNPPILILDEATSALDNATEVMIQDSLNSLSEGRTTIVVAHRLSTIRNADQIAYIADNKILEQGTHDELLATDSNYSRLWNAQIIED